MWNSYCTDWGPAVQLIPLNLTQFQASSVTENTYSFVLHQVIEQRGHTRFLSLHSLVNFQQSFVSAAVGSSSCCELHCNSAPTLPQRPTFYDVSGLLSFHLFLMVFFFHRGLLVQFTLLRTYHLGTWKGWEECPRLLILRLVRELVGGRGNPRTYHQM